MLSCFAEMLVLVPSLKKIRNGRKDGGIGWYSSRERERERERETRKLQRNPGILDPATRQIKEPGIKRKVSAWRPVNTLHCSRGIACAKLRRKRAGRWTTSSATSRKFLGRAARSTADLISSRLPATVARRLHTLSPALLARESSREILLYSRREFAFRSCQRIFAYPRKPLLPPTRHISSPINPSDPISVPNHEISPSRPPRGAKRASLSLSHSLARTRNRGIQLSSALAVRFAVWFTIWFGDFAQPPDFASIRTCLLVKCALNFRKDRDPATTHL